jgi:ABC-type transport system involved in cytochrome c biogenesis permease subunit
LHSALLWTAIAFYGIGIALGLPSFLRRRLTVSTASLGALGFGLLAHAAALALETATIHRLPIMDVRDALSVFSFLATTAFFLLYLRYKIASLGIFMLPLAFVLTLISAVDTGALPASPEFRGWWLIIHIGCILIGYVGFFISFIAAIMYLFQERELKSKRPRTLYYRLPSLEVCDEIYFRSLIIGLPFLTVGIVMGFIGAAREWKGLWELDPKILGALITWFIYLLQFSTRMSGNWQGRRSAYMAVVGFAALMVTFVGISFLSGQHGFFPKFGPTP